VVTAQKQGAESVANVPRSVTAIDRQKIRDAGLTSIEQASRYVPNTLFTGFSARRLSFPYVRGVGSGQGDPAVTTFVDDVPQLDISSTNLSFAGLDRVEVLRGPST
jgi:outer membrane receptor protein involved in Fe transport